MAIDPTAVRALSVELHGRRIGIITRLADDRQLFAFEEAYLEDPDRPTLSLSFKARDGSLVTTPRAYKTRVPPFFANLLPEGHLRSYLAAQNGVKSEREFFLLGALGLDLPGAVVVRPLDEPGQVPTTAASIHPPEGESDPVLRFSLAGVQLKFSAMLEATGGLTVPATGIGGSWIVKLPSSRFPAVPENEYAMIELARAIGLPVPEARLVETGGIDGLPNEARQLDGRALAVRRFDRDAHGSRVHMEDFAQVFGLFPDDKYRRRSYANIASVLWAEAGEDDTFDFVRRLAFSVLTGNADMHLKNWSLLYPDGRRPRLAPAYDLVSTIPYLPDDKLALSLGGSRAIHGISPNQLRKFADTAGLPVSPLWEAVLETAKRTADAWKSLDARDVIPDDLEQLIDVHLLAAASGIAG